MQHTMNLQDEYFAKIKAGTKTVEMRLYDEKRRQIVVGDTILFRAVQSGEQLLVQVKELHVFDNFAQLYASFDKVSIGYKACDVANPDDMLEFYSAQKVATFGVVAIVVQVI